MILAETPCKCTYQTSSNRHSQPHTSHSDMCACASYLPNQANTKKGCSRACLLNCQQNMSLVLTYSTSSHLLSCTTKDNAMPQTMRCAPQAMYTYRTAPQSPDFWRRPISIQRYAMTRPQESLSMWFNRALKGDKVLQYVKQLCTLLTPKSCYAAWLQLH